MLSNLIRHRLFKDTLVLFGVQISGYVLPLVTLPYLARILGPANFGLIGMGTALCGYFYIIVEYGFAVIGTREVAIADNDMDRISRIYSSIMACKLILLAFCFLVLLCLITVVGRLREHWLLYVVSYLFVCGWGLSPTWLLQGVQRMRLIAYSDYGAKILSVLLIFVLVRKPEDVVIAAALQSGGLLVAAIIGTVLVFTSVGLRPVRPEWSEMRSALVKGWPVFLSMASMAAVGSTNTMILAWRTTPDQVGFLAAAQRLVIAARALVNPVTFAIYPHISKIAAKSRLAGVQFLQKQAVWTAAPFLIVSMGMLFGSPLAARILYGPKFAETGVLLQLMSPIPFAHAVSMCFSTYYMLAFGFEKEWSKVIASVMVLNFILLFVTMSFMLPVRAVALTQMLLDVSTAGAVYLFYRRTAKHIVDRPAAEAATVAPVN
jgi:PST family polysaccharide transporter